MESRFESLEPVDIRDEETGHHYAGSAYDIGRKGLRLETDVALNVANSLQVEFRNSPDNIRCFGYVVWARPREEGRGFECGISIQAWHGIVQGQDSWKMYKGIRPKRDRRRKTR